jgi:3-oxoacyl-[acyl-carrier-protein] synthase I
LPAARPGLPPDLATRLTAAMRSRVRACEDLGVFPRGHAAGFMALQAAQQALREGREDVCVVAGVDSWIQPEALEWLETGDRLHGAGELNNAWGRVPGEAGAAVLLASAEVRARWQLPSMARIGSIGVGRESRLADGTEVCTGEGLTQAVQAALLGLPQGTLVDDIVCDMNGERYRANEYAFTALRVRDRLRQASDFIAPADTWGDVGAASAPLGIVAAVVAGLKAYASGPWALVWASSDSSERGAALVDRRPIER